MDIHFKEIGGRGPRMIIVKSIYSILFIQKLLWELELCKIIKPVGWGNSTEF